ncbi:hypothetical protein E5C26_04875 [Serratia proteamaculans]|uniref:hypothetical protein n=1 Tax=Serratia proteamaculans TaxID=28151 RepID=UPI0010760505|nr:hypothetical protein [Serratia proteamaculans]TFZ52542.1 hypothetical protein E5C26_04875 [Serratia proteamaculans]
MKKLILIITAVMALNCTAVLAAPQGNEHNEKPVIHQNNKKPHHNTLPPKPHHNKKPLRQPHKPTPENRAPEARPH